MAVSESDFEKLGYVPFRIDAHRAVVFEKDVWDEFCQLDAVKRARLERSMGLWCEQQKLTPEMFNPNEGRASRGSQNLLLQAFKTRKIRLYGASIHFGGLEIFWIAEIDPAKKQDKADPKVLKKAKDKILDLEVLIKSTIAKLSKRSK